jgi:hypothetical protein
LLSWQGKRDDAIVAARLAVKTDPLSQLIKTNLNYILLDAGMWTEADAVAAEVLQVAPYASLLGNVWIGHLRAGDAEQAATVLLQWATATNRDVEAATALGELIIRAVAMGEEVDLEQTLIDSLQIKGQLPEVYATLRDAENTILSLKDVVATGTGFRSLLSMKINPSYDFIRDDPRFQVLLDEVGLAD